MTSPDLVMVVSYDYRLVALSVFIAMLASYAALDLAGRVTSAQGGVRLLWLSGGATAMGIGIWSMHYIGMLAFRRRSRWSTTGPQSWCRCWLRFSRLPLPFLS